MSAGKSRTVVILLIVMLIDEIITKDLENTELCQYDNDVQKCRMARRQDFLNHTLPQGNCIENNCGTCLQIIQTYILDRRHGFLKPFKFTQRSVPNNTAKTLAYRWEEEGFDCTCDFEKNNCTGSPQYCQAVPCDKESKCHCEMQHVQVERVHYTMDNVKTVNPTIITLNLCRENYSPKEKSNTRHKRSRKLLSDPEAVFINDKLSIQYTQPIVTLNEPGTLIIRANGVEYIKQIPVSLQVVVPPEFLRRRQNINILFISKTGRSVTGTIMTQGTKICHQASCTLCLEFVKNIDCLPDTIKYIFYLITIILSTLAIIYIKAAAYAIWTVLKSIYMAIFQVFRIIRAIARIGLVTGAITGDRLRQASNQMGVFLENGAAAANVSKTALVILALSLIFGQAASTCSSHNILKTKIRNCKSNMINQNSKCQITTTIQLTLNSFGHEACVWMKNEDHKNLFSVKIKLIEANCDWTTSREYYSFNADLNYIFSHNCPQDKSCSWQLHCKRGKHFETLTKESLNYPHIINCKSLGAASGCIIISSRSCLFYALYYIPHLERVYEVKKITGYTCQYLIRIQESYNDTIQDIEITRTGSTKNGKIWFQVLGSYDQPTIFSSEYLISRVGQSEESYIDSAAARGRPEKGKIGHFQANRTITNDFLFPQDEAVCDFYEASMKCHQHDSYLTQLYTTKERALPMIQGFHSMYMNDDQLKSKLLVTAPVVLQMNFKDYEVILQTQTICPEFADNKITVIGCHSCNILATMTFTALSKCGQGHVDVNFQNIKIYTQAVTVSTTRQQITIQFLGIQRCAEDQLCLSGNTVKACRKVKYCLDDPSIELTQLNMTQKQGFAMQQATSWYQGLNFLGTISWGQHFKWLMTFAILAFAGIFLIAAIRMCISR